MNRRVSAYLVMIAVAISVILFGKIVYASAAEDNTITKGVFIDQIDVSGMTEEEAKAAVNDFVKELKTKEISIRVDQNSVISSMGELGFSYTLNDTIDRALNLGTSGNLIKRYKELKDIENDGMHFPLEFSIDDNIVRELISSEVTKYNVEPINAIVSRKNGQMIYTDHVLGKSVDLEATVRIISDKILNSWDRNDLILDAYMEDVTPIYTRDIVEQCDARLGSFTTEYADSAQGRASNLANGARLINNTVIYPGEVFSGYEHLSPFNKQNGYYVAGAYSKGKVIDSIGGGACQVTTTLYNAALEAELEIVERKSHSMTISYASLSRDAAIAGTYKDLKFKNNTDIPILIQAYTKGRSITFVIWGNETRDTANRNIKFETRVLSETRPPADVIEEDPTKPISYRRVTQSSHTGYKAELYKVVYENGVEVSRTLINKSNYTSAPRYIIIGTMKPVKTEDDQQEVDTDKEAQKPEEEAIIEEAIIEEDEGSDEAVDSDDNDQQLQWDDFWDPAWDEEEYEDIQ